MLLPVIGVWLILMVIGILNGAFRILVLQPKLGPYPAHLASSLLLAILILAATFIFVRRSVYSKGELLLIGAIWLGLTILFEFGFGHYVMGHPWEKLLADYNILKGRLWSLALATILLAPRLCGTILRRPG